MSTAGIARIFFVEGFKSPLIVDVAEWYRLTSIARSLMKPLEFNYGNISSAF